MKKCWKRILAATLAACMIFCDSSLVYATESQQVVEASETETEVDTLEIPEILEEEPVEEETVVEETIVEESIQEEVLLEERSEEETEVVEIMPVTEVSTAEQMNSATGNTVLAPGEEVTVSGSDTRYVKDFDFTAEDSGKHYLYVQGESELNLSYIQVYKADGTTIDSMVQPELCYDLDVDAKDKKDVYELARGYILEEGTTYKINVQGSVAEGEEAIFWFGKAEEDHTRLVADSNTETIKSGEMKIYEISEETTQTGALFWTGDNPDIYVTAGAGTTWQYTFNNLTKTEGQRALIIPAGQTYYVSVYSKGETDTQITWKHVDSKPINIGEMDSFTADQNNTPVWSFYEFEPSVERDYLISANNTKSDGSWDTNQNMYTAVLLQDDTLGIHKYTYTSKIDSSTKNYGEDYTDGYEHSWLRVKYPENCKKFYICAWQSSSYWDTTVYLQEIVHPKTLTPNVEVAISGGSIEEEYSVWYEITPTEDTYYYFESNDLEVAEVGIWNEESQMYYTEFPDFFYKFREGAADYLDVQKCYKLEENVRYGIRIWGMVPTNGTSFIWKKTSEDHAPAKLNLEEEENITGNCIYEISEETTTLGLLSYADYGFGDVGFFGDGISLTEYQEGNSGTASFKRNYVVLMPANKRLFVTTKALTNSKLAWNLANSIVLNSGYDETIAPTEDTIKLYEFTPEKLKSYQVLVQENVTEIVMVDDDGYLHSAGTEFTDENNNRWIQYSPEELEYIEKVYVIAKVKANGTGRVAFRELTSVIDESNINNILTTNQNVSVSGGESGNNIQKWYDFVPETSGYYYLESDTFKDASYGVYDEITGLINYTPNLEVKCTLKQGATTVKDVLTSHFFEAGKQYKVYIYGTVAANTSKTFIWKECDAIDNAIEVSLNDEPITVPGAEISIYKLHAEETTVANVFVNGWNLLDVYGDNYTGLLRGYTDGYTNQHEKVMSVGKGKTYYYVLAPTEDVTITFKEEEAKTIKPGDSFTVEAISDVRYDIVCHEFVPEVGAKYEAHYGIGGGNKAIAIIEKNGNLSWVTEGTITGADGKLWTEINGTENIEKVYLFTLAEAGTPQIVSLKSDKPTNPSNITLDTFDGVINVPAGETVTVTYEGPHLGDYFIANNGLKFKSIYVGPGLKAPVLYTWLNSGQFYTYSFADKYDVNTTDTAKFTFTLENTTAYDQSVSIGNSAKSYTWDSNLNENGNLIWSADMETEKSDFYASYYKFTAEETTVYSHPEIVWVMRVQDANGNNKATRWDKYELEDGKIILNAGETYIFKFISNKSDDEADSSSIPAIYAESCWTTTDSRLFYDGEDDDISVYRFTPMLSGRYSNGTENQIVTVWEQNAENGTWTKVSKLTDSATGYADYELSSEKEYFVVFDESTVFGLKSNVTVLDYDYYDTFVNTATGGAISVDANGKVTITPQSKGAKLVAKICSILGIADYSDEDILDEFEDGNAYWKGFVPKKFYKLVEGQLVEDVEGVVEDGDVVVVKYEPEVVWVHSMTVTADKTVLNIDDESQIYVDAKAATTKYPLNSPIFTYVSSNPEIVSVDKTGKMTALAAGKVKITVMADVALRFAEGCSNKILKKEFYVTVSQRFNVNYENMYDVNGEPIGNLNENTPITYNTLEVTALGKPETVEGYDFVGWYSNEALTKEVKSIPKGSTGDKTYYAKWKLHDYNIKYELGDGKFATDAKQPTQFTMAEETVLVDPILQGYVLDYWYWEVDDGTGNMIEQKLPCVTDPEDSSKVLYYYLPKDLKNDVEIFAKWKFNTRFSLEINAVVDENATETVEYTIIHPYNSATGEWEYLNSSFAIQADKEGMHAELYANENETPSVTVKLWKLDENGLIDPSEEPVTWSSKVDRYVEYKHYRVTEILSKDMKDPGKYVLEVSYTHPGQVAQEISQKFTVKYAKREYPVNKEITLEKLSDVEKEKLGLGTKDVTFSMITSELVNKMQPIDENEEPVKVDGYLLKELVSDIIIKNSKNKIVSHETKLSNGTYTITLVLKENEKFLEEATSTVKIGYGTIKAAGVQYTDEDGNTSGTKIATNPNKTPYPDHCVITPLVQLPWMEQAISVNELKEALEKAKYPGYNISIIAENYNDDILNVEPVVGEETEIITGLKVTGKTPGKSNILLTTCVTSENGSLNMNFPVTIKNFTVVSGDKEAIEKITFERFCEVLMTDGEEEENDYPVYAPKNTGENDEDTVVTPKMYLVESPSNEARKFRIYWSALDFGGASVTSALNWKSSNTKLASLKAKEKYVEVTVPKNAQGVVEITATAKDEGKRSQSMKLVIVDTKMRLETTSLTMNSKLEDESAIAYLYPNVLSSEMEGVSKESLFGNTITVGEKTYERIAIYKKIGKKVAEKSEISDIFDSSYDFSNGELTITFNSEKYPVKPATHTVYVGILHEKDIIEAQNNGMEIPNPSEWYPLKIKDTCALPKAPSIKVTKSYETAYTNGWAELTMTLKNPAAKVENTNIPEIEVEKVDDQDKYEAYDWKDVNGDGTVWNFKLCVKDEVPTKTLNNVKFLVKYDGYRAEEMHSVKTNISVTNNPPKLYVYGEESYAPVYYTDVDFRCVDVMIPVTEEMVPGFATGYKVESNADSTGVRITKDSDSSKYLEITAKDASRIQIDAENVEYYKNYGEIPAKKGEMQVAHAIKLSVWIQRTSNPKAKEGNVNLSFYVESSELGNKEIETQKLTVKPRTVKSDSISLVNSLTEQTVKSLTFNSDSAYRGKEFIELQVQKPTDILKISELNNATTGIVVEAADNNTKKMLQNNELLVEVKEANEAFKITPTNKAFNYKSAKLKVTMQVSNGDISAQTKSVTLGLSFKKVPAPKITIGAAKMIRNMQYGVKSIEGIESKVIDRTQTVANVKFANMPVGSKVIDIRFADRADYVKYYAPNNYDWGNKLPEKLYLEARENVDLPLGKDSVDLIYDVQTVAGDVISISTAVTLTIVDSLSIKTDVKNMNLFNSAIGIDYGKSAVFYDAKGNAVEVKEIANAEELKKAGISFEILSADDAGYEGKGVVRFYVDNKLNRGIEKTYTVKVKVAAVNSAVKNDAGAWNITKGTEKVLTFKLILKK